MKSRLIVNGAAGRMGRRIVALSCEDGGFEIVGAAERGDHPEIGRDAGVLAGVGEVGVSLGSEYPSDADVMIDFTWPGVTDDVIAHCVSNGISLVIGTTGLSDEQQEGLVKASERIAVVYATNMSVGMNVLFTLVAKAAQMLGEEYDIEIVEAHHRFKKDAPSGSALSLAESVAEATGRDWPGCLVHGRQGGDALREKGSIGMHAIRGGDITGQHSVIYSTLGETVRLSHDAHNRDNFVHGALRAGLWLRGKEAGMYTMKQVLGVE